MTSLVSARGARTLVTADAVDAAVTPVVGARAWVAREAVANVGPHSVRLAEGYREQDPRLP